MSRKDTALIISNYQFSVVQRSLITSGPSNVRGLNRGEERVENSCESQLGFSDPLI